MKVEAIKVDKGFLIPFNKVLKKIKKDRILMEIEIIEPEKIKQGYDILDELVGLYESKNSNASINHDEIIYNLKRKKK